MRGREREPALAREPADVRHQRAHEVRAHDRQILVEHVRAADAQAVLGRRLDLAAHVAELQPAFEKRLAACGALERAVLLGPHEIGGRHERARRAHRDEPDAFAMRFDAPYLVDREPRAAVLDAHRRAPARERGPAAVAHQKAQVVARRAIRLNLRVLFRRQEERRHHVREAAHERLEMRREPLVRDLLEHGLGLRRLLVAQRRRRALGGARGGMRARLRDDHVAVEQARRAGAQQRVERRGRRAECGEALAYRLRGERRQIGGVGGVGMGGGGERARGRVGRVGQGGIGHHRQSGGGGREARRARNARGRCRAKRRGAHGYGATRSASARRDGGSAISRSSPLTNIARAFSRCGLPLVVRGSAPGSTNAMRCAQ
ncbi:hypothetical protein DO72_1555 [Burkholderia pseudomallei]|nr:hypothetical protein DO72_1555 [Burkholderia pseudomallei]